MFVLQEIDVKAGGGHNMMIGEMLRTWLSKLEWYSTLFPRIPVPIQKVSWFVCYQLIFLLSSVMYSTVNTSISNQLSSFLDYLGDRSKSARMGRRKTVTRFRDCPGAPRYVWTG